MAGSWGIRTFLNCDPPAMAEVWLAHHRLDQSGRGHIVQQIELAGLAKTYFDPAGLLIAESNGQLLGWIHVGFGCRSDSWQLDRHRACLACLAVRPGPCEDALAAELIDAAHLYALRHGASEIFGGPCQQLAPFYLGTRLAAGPPGVADHDSRRALWLQQSGYQLLDRTTSWELDVSRFRQPVDRHQIALRRQARVEPGNPSLPLIGCQAIALSHIDRIAYRLCERGNPQPLGEAIFWHPELGGLGSDISVHLSSAAPDRPLPLDHAQHVYLLSEAIKQLQLERVPLVHTTTFESDHDLTAVYLRLGFGKPQNGTLMSYQLA